MENIFKFSNLGKSSEHLHLITYQRDRENQSCPFFRTSTKVGWWLMVRRVRWGKNRQLSKSISFNKMLRCKKNMTLDDNTFVYMTWHDFIYKDLTLYDKTWLYKRQDFIWGKTIYKTRHNLIWQYISLYDKKWFYMTKGYIIWQELNLYDKACIYLTKHECIWLLKKKTCYIYMHHIDIGIT